VTIRAAVVGAGLMGRWHAHELARAGGTVTAVVDPDEAAARRVAAGAPTFAELGGALELGVDAVHVCSPSSTHVELVRQSLAAGADVLVEKPLAPDLAATRAVVEEARAAGRLLCPVHQYLYQPGFVLLQRTAPELAPLSHLEATTFSAGGEGRPAAELDTIAADILPHLLASVERALPGGLAAVEWTGARLGSGELRATGAAGETTVFLCVSMNGRPTRNELRLTGAGGTIELDFFHGYGFTERGAPSRMTKIARPFAISARRAGAAGANLGRRALRREPAYPGLRTLIERFYAARGSAGPPIAFEETIAVAAARDELLALAGSEAAAGQHERHGAQEHLGVEPE
jgi:predicted dehydrogenase